MTQVQIEQKRSSEADAEIAATAAIVQRNKQREELRAADLEVQKKELDAAKCRKEREKAVAAINKAKADSARGRAAKTGPGAPLKGAAAGKRTAPTTAAAAAAAEVADPGEVGLPPGGVLALTRELHALREYKRAAEGRLNEGLQEPHPPGPVWRPGGMICSAPPATISSQPSKGLPSGVGTTAAAVMTAGPAAAAATPLSGGGCVDAVDLTGCSPTQ